MSRVLVTGYVGLVGSPLMLCLIMASSHHAHVLDIAANSPFSACGEPEIMDVNLVDLQLDESSEERFGHKSDGLTAGRKVLCSGWVSSFASCRSGKAYRLPALRHSFFDHRLMVASHLQAGVITFGKTGGGHYLLRRLQRQASFFV